VHLHQNVVDCLGLEVAHGGSSKDREVSPFISLGAEREGGRKHAHREKRAYAQLRSVPFPNLKLNENGRCVSGSPCRSSVGSSRRRAANSRARPPVC
jgi:hypothetical protein